MSAPKLIVCHFTLEELEYINDLMIRNQVLTKHIRNQLKDLDLLGVKLEYLPQPDMVGKLLSYIRQGDK